jgi:hypothetical protein
MKRFILPLWLLTMIFLMSIVIGAIQSGVNDTVKQHISTAKNVSCSPRILQEGSFWEPDILLVLDCGGKYTYTNDKKLIITYANKQRAGQLVCTTFKSGAATCKLVEK